MAANATTALAAKTKASEARTTIISGHCAFVAACVKPADKRSHVSLCRTSPYANFVGTVTGTLPGGKGVTE
jgi:hypothetical protein